MPPFFSLPSLQVHLIASLSISSLSLVQATPNSKYHAFPLGYSAQFIAHLHDNVGRRFDYAEVSLSHRLDRYDTVIVSPESGNTTYSVKASRQGDALLRIWVSASPRATDYVRIRVGYAILPSLATVHLGSLVCFSTHLTEDKPGWWSVGGAGEEGGGVMTLDPTSGIGNATGVGRTVVYHKVEDTTDTHTEITVTKVERAEFNVSTATLAPFTNGRRREGAGDYRLPVQFRPGGGAAGDNNNNNNNNNNGGETFTPIHTSPNKECLRVTMGMEMEAPPTQRGRFYYIQQVPFECHAELRDATGADVGASRYLDAQATFDPYTGESYCSLLPVDTPSSSSSGEGLATQDGLRLSLRVTAFDRLQSYFVMSDSLAVPFEPGFHLSRRELILSSIDTSLELTVTGLLHVLQTIKVRGRREGGRERERERGKGRERERGESFLSWCCRSAVPTH